MSDRLRRVFDPTSYEMDCTSRAFRNLLAAHKGLQSLSRPRQCWDNAVADSFFATLREELVYRLVLPTR